MAKLIALEWDTREARVAVGNVRGSEIVVEQAFSVDLGAADADALSTSEIRDRLSQALTGHGLTGVDALVAMPRSNIELRHLSLPPAPPEERPEMVRFQAMQAFSAIGEDWPLDYVELESTEESIDVLAAVVSPNQISLINKICAASDLKPRRMVLRPFATASLLRRSRALEADRCRLIVDVLDTEADLTAVYQGQVVFMRTVRLPTDPKVRSTALAGELRRTIGAAQNQMGGTRIEQIVICGADEECASLKENLSMALSLDVVTFDPLAAVRVGRPLRAAGLDHPGRFAALIGMLADDAAGANPGVDFLNPRKRPAPPSKKRRNIVIAVAALLLVGLGAIGVWATLKRYDADIALLTQQKTDMEKALDSARALMAKAGSVKEEFADGDVTWLDEIHEVARGLPDADTAILEEVTMGTGNMRGGTIVLKGNVTTSAKIEEFEDSLRYNKNIVSGRQGTIDRTNSEYPWLLDTVVIVTPDVQDTGRSIGRPFREEIRAKKEDRDAQAQAAAETDADDDSQPPEDPIEGTETEDETPSEAAPEGAESGTESVTPDDDSAEPVTPAESETPVTNSSEETEQSESAPPAEDINTDSAPSSAEPVNTTEITETQPS